MTFSRRLSDLEKYLDDEFSAAAALPKLVETATVIYDADQFEPDEIPELLCGIDAACIVIPHNFRGPDDLDELVRQCGAVVPTAAGGPVSLDEWKAQHCFEAD